MVHKNIKEISTSIKGHNSVENEQKYFSIIQNYILSISLHIQNLIEIHKLIHKITTFIRYNMDLLYINAYTKFYQNSSICSEDIEEKHILHKPRAITLLFINEFSPFAIPNHSFLISVSMQSLKKISQKLLKLESGNEALTDAGRSFRGFRGLSDGNFI